MKKSQAFGSLLSISLIMAAAYPMIVSAAGASGSTSVGGGASSGNSNSATTAAGSSSATSAITNDGGGMSTSGSGATRIGAKSTNASGNTVTSWSDESSYWRNNFSSRPYASNKNYSTYEPAYRYGYESYNRYGGKRFDEIDAATLRNDWARNRGTSNLTWDQAQDAVRDSYNRMYETSRANSASGVAPANGTGTRGTTGTSSTR